MRYLLVIIFTPIGFLFKFIIIPFFNWVEREMGAACDICDRWYK